MSSTSKEGSLMNPIAQIRPSLRLLVLALLAATWVALAAGRASAATAYADLPGDAGTAPDIGAVSMSNDANGQITFQISVPNQPQLASDAAILLLLDTDMNGSTGDTAAGGVDYAVVLDGETHSFAFGRWDGADFASTQSETVQVGYSSGAFISVNASELGNPTSIRFWVRGIQGTEPVAGAYDDAPDGAALWTYLMSVGQSGLYTDAAGDSGTAADIGTVSVSNNEAGQLAFQINTNQPTQAADGVLLLLLDTDQNSATGNVDALGADYVYVRDGETSTYSLGRWDGSQFDYSTASTTVVSFWASGASFTVNRSELGSTSGFNFWIRTLQGDQMTPGTNDEAPDVATWNYQVAGAPSTAPPAPKTPRAAPLKLTVARVFAKPSAPVPGTLFTVFADVRRSDTGADLDDGTVKCRAAVSLRKIVVTRAGFLKGTPACTVRIPAGTAGKMLRGTITVAAEGATVRRTFSYRVGEPKRRAASVEGNWRLSVERLSPRVLGGHTPIRGLAVDSASAPWIPVWLGPLA
jgi:hypothetical protein